MISIIFILVYVFSCWSGWYMYKWAYEKGKKEQEEIIKNMRKKIANLQMQLDVAEGWTKINKGVKK
jgi:mannose/fructose/N-acetylgalactosamine-specific phosphotransferase system component IID